MTYNGLLHDFVYPVVILDACSQHIDAAIICSALDAAIAERTAFVGYIHHSDRCVQYAAHDYMNIFEEDGFHHKDVSKRKYLRQCKSRESHEYVQSGEGLFLGAPDVCESLG
jgi:transposase InsO family protein